MYAAAVASYDPVTAHRIDFALAATAGPVRAVDLPDLYAAAGQQPGQPVPVAAGAFPPGIGDLAEPRQPPRHPGVPGIGRGNSRTARRRPSRSSTTATCTSLCVSTPTIRPSVTSVTHPSLTSTDTDPHRPGQDTHHARAGNAPIGSLGHAAVGAGPGR